MNSFLGRAVAGLVFVASSFGIAVSSADDATPEVETDGITAEHILTRVADVYKACKSYSDAGESKTVIFEGDLRRHVDRKPFTTAFVRPDRFRFEFSLPLPVPGAQPMPYIVWANDRDVRTWFDAGTRIEEEVSLGMALGGALGVSGGCSHTIPVLLMPEEIEGGNVAELQQPNRIADSVLDEVACYCIQGRREENGLGSITLWISKRTCLIHRIDRTNKFPTFRTETTTTYKPKVDAVIDESRLVFNAPEKASN